MQKTVNNYTVNIPHLPGVYIMRDSSANIIYIGKAKDLKNRITSYFHSDINSKSASIISSMTTINYILCSSEREALLVERELIKKVQPHFNAMWKDDKSYPYIKLTMNEDFPRLIMSRKLLKDGGLYFGPYPQITYIKKLIFWLNKIFKIRPCKISFLESSLPERSKVKSCLYYHTDLCYGPCMGYISSVDYKNNLKEIELFLKGKFQKLQKIWNLQMIMESKNQEYEKAREIRDRLFAINSMSERVTVTQINLEEINQYVSKTDALQELKEVLKLKNLPAIMECFDISNTSGTNPVASMVKFTNGKPDKNGYRRFKIKTVTGINDFAMIYEAVFRRYSSIIRNNEKFPDLIVVDGGKGQLASAEAALNELGVFIPLISLAKQNEEIFVMGKSKPIILSKNMLALRLLQSIRNEAHRFAITFHKQLRAKEFLQS
ncbi:MAG: excinuclease ABC subunit UvrC [Endomicrobiaceae bacterium]|jgi:excinuclease ABC subunit C|nr:excinuclease ABC subunit UvrC [Endomicrobiaceae bacterium]MDD3052856.1 excinuclease ABC subunit UvrC [Endomicrobiaceae bacterium]MDD3922774.1 excinuclease ABC subunit UvrC [Endomicrobiaceae bacterium]